LNRVKPSLVFLVFWRTVNHPKMLTETRELFLRNKAFLEENGFTVGAWICPTIGYGSAPGPWDNDPDEKYMRLRRLNGEKLMGSFCPLCEGFKNDFLRTVKAAAQCGVKQILFEDDFAFVGGKYEQDSGCACNLHMRKYRKLIGENISRKDLRKKIFSGGENKYRTAWLQLQAETLLDLASAIEKQAHEIDGDIRLGMCANNASYDMEAAPLPELVKTIAGKSRPFVRLTAAPYWRWATIPTIIDAIRYQAALFGSEVETISEGDTYPRPRYNCPAARLETYDMILRASGCTNGILKYMLDYSSSHDYETGYVDRHVKNQRHYKEIDRRFTGKECVGIRVFEVSQTFKTHDFGEDLPIERYDNYSNLPTTAMSFAQNYCLPTVFTETDGAAIVFGENARYLTEQQLKQGVVIDAAAAKILMQRGIDVGIENLERLSVLPSLEIYPAYDERVFKKIPAEQIMYNMRLKENVEILSYNAINDAAGMSFVGVVSKDKIPASFRYENAQGMRFLVYSFVAKTVVAEKVITNRWEHGRFNDYASQRQLVENIEWLSGKKLPAVTLHNTNLYTLCKKDEKSMAVGLWNYFVDEVLEPKIYLDKTYSSIDFYNCSGRLEGDCVVLDNEIPAFGFAFFTVYE